MKFKSRLQKRVEDGLSFLLLSMLCMMLVFMISQC